jgi:hypothetical protein
MDQNLEKQIAELETMVEALPEYMTRDTLYLNLPEKGEPRLSLPVSIGLALDRLNALRNERGLTTDQRARLAGLEGRIKAVERLYPSQYKQKLESEMRSRKNTARWKAEDADEERDRWGKP